MMGSDTIPHNRKLTSSVLTVEMTTARRDLAPVETGRAELQAAASLHRENPSFSADV